MSDLVGSAEGETLVGTDGPDTIDGLGGNDVIDGAGGADTMKGGAGDDVFHVDDVGDQVIELSGEGTDEVRSSIAYTLSSHVENLVLTGNAVSGTGNGLNNRITGNDSANILSGGGGSDIFVGGGGDDLYSVEATVFVDGSGGYAFGQLDQVVEAAGGGIDTIRTNAGGTLPAEVENMILTGSLDLTAFGNALGNVLTGNDGRNFMRGGDGDDRLDGGAGGDNMDGGAGDDIYVVDDPLDRLTEAPDGGTDTVLSAISHVLDYSFERLTLTGEAAIDGTGNHRDNRIVGNVAANALAGGGGNDSIEGGEGDDGLSGGFGADTMFGGAGNDSLRGGADNDLVQGDDGDDLVFNDDGGSDASFGGAGNDGFFFGNRLDAGDVNDGGDGLDTLAIRGLMAPGFEFGADNLRDIEVLLVASGANLSFPAPGGTNAGSFSYDLITRDANVAAGAILTVVAGSPGGGISGLQSDESLGFDGSAETNGAFRIFAGLGEDRLIGGEGGDGFFFETGALTAADRVDGGAGIDSLALRGDYEGPGDDGGAALVLGEASISGIEVLALLSGHDDRFGGAIVPEGFDYDLTMADGNVGAGEILIVSATGLGADEMVRFDGSAEADGSFRILSGAGDDWLVGGAGADQIHGGLGADWLDGGLGFDTYIYRAAGESTSAARDTLMLGDGDRVDLSYFDGAFAFVGAAAFSGGASELRAYQSGDQWIVEGDVDGDLVADLVISVASADPILAGDFIL